MPTNWTKEYRNKRYAKDSKEPVSRDFDLFYNLSKYEQSVDVECAWSKIHKKITENSSKGYIPLLRIAAMLVVALGIIFSAYHYLGSGVENHQLTEVKNEDSSIKTYSLPDGSVITLSENAQISFVNATFKEVRKMTLSGKAYFEVAKSKRPFTITTTAGTVRVLGTSFSLNSISGLDVYVTSGAVEMSSEFDQKIIKKGQRAYVAKKGIIKIDSTDDNLNHASWKTGQFRFENTVLKEIIPYLEKYYEVKISTNRSIKNCRVTAEFNKDSFEDVLSVLTTILNAKSQISGNKVKLSGEGCN